MSVDTIRLISTGMWVPTKVLTNADLERMVDTTDEWIVERTGIRERRIAGDDIGVVEMGYRAAQDALEGAGMEPSDVDALIVSTATPDRLLPATACDMQAKLDLHSAVAFDVWGACTGWLYSLNVARGLIISGQIETALCVATEKMSAITDWTDRSTCVLFGDAAGAALVQRSEEKGRGILASYMRSDGSLAELLHRAPSSAQPIPIDVAELTARDGYMRMAGREVFKNAVRSMCEAVDAVLDQAGVAKGEIDLLVPHQANIRIIEATAKYARVPMERVWVNVDRYGNTSSATVPVAIHEARQQGAIKDGSLVLMVAFGAGLTWAGTLLRW
ncbi:MAG: ketoacyl-ACP synthase III [Gemmatimonadota bacterium]|nr:MAG: ketoacyl-ACP synthase III [Gemmatimonadota bacterium]